MKPSYKRNSLRRKRRIQNPEVAYDSLEVRLPLTTFVVNTAGDAGNLSDGLISLREAAIAANTNAAYGDAPAGSANGDVIQLHSDIVQIELSLGAIELTDDVAIHSDNESQVVVTSKKSSGLFEVDTNEKVGFRNLYLYNGSASGGGAVRISGGGITNFTDVNFQSNYATQGSGGAIHHHGGRLNILDSVFADNSAHQADGGAIVSFAGILNIQSSTFDSNSAQLDGAAIELVNGRLNANDVTFSGNWNFTYGSGQGGAVGLHGTSVARIQLGTFDGNWASHGGGGVWVSETSSLSVHDSNFLGNLADGESGFGGGAIFNDGGNLLARNTTFSSNFAGGTGGDGGAILANGGFNRIDFGAFDSNSASRSGGAIYVDGGRLLMRNLSMTGNQAGYEPLSIEGIGDGGAIYLTGENASAVISGSTIENSKAANSGGAVWVGDAARIRFSNVTMGSNQADGTELNTGGGALFSDGGRLGLYDTSVIDNQARAGGAIYLNGGSAIGYSATIDGNSGSRYGGAIANFDGFTQLTTSTLNGNTTSQTGKGGALYMQGRNVRSVFYRSEMTANTAGSGGGAFVESGNRLVLLAQSQVSSNIASSGNGGGIYSDGHVHSRETVFMGNAAGGNGGGLYLSESGTARIEGGQFVENTTIAYGGGIFNGGELFHHLVDFTDNLAGIDGDSIYEFPAD